MTSTQPAAFINTTKTYPNPISLHPKPATHRARGLFTCMDSKRCYSTISGRLQELKGQKKSGNKAWLGWLGFVRQVRRAQEAARINDPVSPDISRSPPATVCINRIFINQLKAINQLQKDKG